MLITHIKYNIIIKFTKGVETGLKHFKTHCGYSLGNEHSSLEMGKITDKFKIKPCNTFPVEGLTKVKMFSIQCTEIDIQF